MNQDGEAKIDCDVARGGFIFLNSRLLKREKLFRKIFDSCALNMMNNDRSSEIVFKLITYLNYLYGTGTSCKYKFRKENLQTVFVVAGGGFLSYWNHQLIKFEEEKIKGFRWLQMTCCQSYAIEQGFFFVI